MEKTKTVVKTVKQYNKYPIPSEEMAVLQEIAEKYRKVKNYVYSRYGSSKYISELSPGYRLSREMNESDIRQQIGIPSKYFEKAKFDAFADMKMNWSSIVSKIRKLAMSNENFNAADKHYINFILKNDKYLQAVINRDEKQLKEIAGKYYDKVVTKVDKHKLDNYINRQIRRNSKTLYTENNNYFVLKGDKYNYSDSGIRISTFVPREKIEIELTDSNKYSCQLTVKIYPEKNSIEIYVPIEVKVKEHSDYTNQIGIALGMYDMLTASTGNVYGADFESYMNNYSEWLYKKKKSCQKGVGREKYDAQNHRYEERLYSYINHQINLMLEAEKPCVIFIPKYPKHTVFGKNKKANFMTSAWKRKYICDRIAQKCRENSIELIEVISTDIGVRCSKCGEVNKEKAPDKYVCEKCGYTASGKLNAAQNAYFYGISGMYNK